jgi:hypothetical protein
MRQHKLEEPLQALRADLHTPNLPQQSPLRADSHLAIPKRTLGLPEPLAHRSTVGHRQLDAIEGIGKRRRPRPAGKVEALLVNALPLPPPRKIGGFPSARLVPKWGVSATGRLSLNRPLGPVSQARSQGAA